MRALAPDNHAWTMDTALLASAVDSLNLLVWAKTKDAQKNRNRPKPIPRPWDKPQTEQDTHADDIDTVKNLLARNRT